MQFKIIQYKDKLVDDAYEKSMVEFSEFYGFRWVYNKPHLIIVDNRKVMDAWRNKKTPRWNTAWADRNRNYVFILDRKKFEKETNRKYSKDTYCARIKHEISHRFFKITSKNGFCPVWFDEGVAIYTSGQNKWTDTPKKFITFLSFNKDGGEGVYQESGFVVELLVEKFGKEKLLNLIKQSKNSKNNTDFKKLFSKIYGFNLNYRNINKLHSECKTKTA